MPSDEKPACGCVDAVNGYGTILLSDEKCQYPAALERIAELQRIESQNDVILRQLNALLQAERERDAARAALRTILNGEKRTDGFAPPPWVLHIARAALGQEGGSDGA